MERMQTEQPTGAELPENKAPERYTEHALYRHFDAQGVLLYVGISLHAMVRLTQHRDASEWYEQSVRMTIERFASRRELLLAERIAIRKERPRYNISLARITPADIREDQFSAFRLSGDDLKIALLKRMTEMVYTEETLCNQLYLRQEELDAHIKAGNIRFFLGTGGYSAKIGGRKKVRLFTGWAVLNLLEFMERQGK